VNKEDGTKAVENLKQKLHKEMLDLLEAEQKKETERDEQLQNANEEEKQKLEKTFGTERAKASDRIIKMSEYTSFYNTIGIMIRG
jgi:hypothetical protein